MPGSPAKALDVTKEALVFDTLYTHVREEADGTGTRQTTARIRILADAGVKQMAVQTFTYTASNQQVDVAYVRVIKPDGSVVVTPAYNIQDLPADETREAPMYSDIHQKHVAVKGLGVGDTLEYQVTLRTLKPDVPDQFWLEYTFDKDIIILDEELDLDVPADKPVTVASADVQPTVTTSAGRKLYHWVSSNLSRPDPDAPAKSTKHWKPSVQVTTFTSWQQVGAWYAALQKEPLEVTPAIQARAAALTKGLTSDEDKIRALFNDVAMHIHYVGLDFGIGRYQPHPADDVLSNEYGDCKDKHTLLATLLKASGIEAWPVLISSSRPLDPGMPSPAQFDHVITLVPLQGKPIWMDSTAEIAPVGVLFANLRDKQALAIPTDKPAYLEQTPADLPFAQSTHFEVTGKLSNEGVFTGHFTESFHGDTELIYRAALRSVPQSQWKDFLQGVSNITGFGGEVSNPDVSAIEQTGQPVRCAYDYTREKYGEWDNHRISPPMPPIGWELAPGVKQKKPADDVEIGSPGELVYSSSVQLPSGWMLFPPAGTGVKEDWAEYHSTYAFADGKFTAERRLVVRKDKVPLDQWDKYLAFRRAVFDDEVRMMPLQNPAEPSKWQGATGSAFAPQILGPGAQAQLSEDARQKIQTVLENLRSATEILEADSPATTEGIAKALSSSRKAVDDIEEISLTLSAEDAHSLYWGQLLGYAWSTLGWSALESKDLPVAEVYLRAAWHLCHDRITGYQLGRLLDARNNKAAAAHQYELAHVTSVSNPLGGFLASDYKLDDLIAASYRKIAGKELTATSLNRGQYNGSLDAELDKELEIHQFLRATKLTGSGLYAIAFEGGKPVKANFLQGDKGFAELVPTLQAHTFPAQLPSGSKARLLREVRVICSPWAGCDAYLLLPGSIELPSRTNFVNVAPPPNSPPGTKTVRIQVQP
jgi:transglutaminase-like putative cysteine protease